MECMQKAILNCPGGSTVCSHCPHKAAVDEKWVTIIV